MYKHATLTPETPHSRRLLVGHVASVEGHKAMYGKGAHLFSRCFYFSLLEAVLGRVTTLLLYLLATFTLILFRHGVCTRHEVVVYAAPTTHFQVQY